MPLPFLTADRAFDANAGEAETALPFDDDHDHDHWRRPYRPGPWRVAAAALSLLLASFVLIAAMITAFAGEPAGAGACLGLSVVMILAALRLLRAGVWVSLDGLRRTAFFRTRTVAWSEITPASGVRTVQQPVRWLGLPRTVQGQALVMEVRGGGPEPVVLMTDHNADFLGRVEGFERAADAVEVWGAEYGRG